MVTCSNSLKTIERFTQLLIYDMLRFFFFFGFFVTIFVEILKIDDFSWRIFWRLQNKFLASEYLEVFIGRNL